MQNKDLIIIALLVLVVYLYWQQTQQKTLPIQFNNQELQELRNQVNHYQTLYQKRVEADITGNQEKQIQSLTENLTSSQQQNSLYQQKIISVEKQLLDIAKQKVKGKKDAEKLLIQLEKDWQVKREDYEKNIQQKEQVIKELGKKSQEQKTLLESQLTHTKQEIKALNSQKRDLETKYLKIQTDFTTAQASHSKQLAQQKQINEEQQRVIEDQYELSESQEKRIKKLQAGLDVKTNQLQEANKLVSTDKRWLDERYKECQEKMNKILEIIDKPLVFFYGKKEVLEYLKPQGLED